MSRSKEPSLLRLLYLWTRWTTLLHWIFPYMRFEQSCICWLLFPSLFLLGFYFHRCFLSAHQPSPYFWNCILYLFSFLFIHPYLSLYFYTCCLLWSIYSKICPFLSCCCYLWHYKFFMLFKVFGQSECTGPHTVSSPGNWKVGTCGRPIQGSESIVDPVNGELCYRGDTNRIDEWSSDIIGDKFVYFYLSVIFFILFILLQLVAFTLIFACSCPFFQAVIFLWATCTCLTRPQKLSMRMVRDLALSDINEEMIWRKERAREREKRREGGRERQREREKEKEKQRERETERKRETKGERERRRPKEREGERRRPKEREGERRRPKERDK